MVAFLVLLGVSHSAWAWAQRRLLAEAAIGLLLAGAPFLIMAEFGLVAHILLDLAQAWGILLGARLIFGRLPEEFLRRSTQMNSAVALGIFVVAFDVRLLEGLLGIPTLSTRKVVVVALLFSIVVGIGFLYQILWTLKHYRLRQVERPKGLRDLPTVTLAIPARNETHALEACLQAALASTYPKLEVIVLDDCSQDRTSEIIRSFAHDGVRFVQGDVPAEGWLGKNQAQRTLAEQASGDFIIFMDVDTHVAPQSIGVLIGYVLANKLDMMTVLPQRRDDWSLATVLTYLRYFWQIALPVTARRVPVASQLWLIRRKTLAKLGGFDAVRQKIAPEGFFARRLITNDAYRFIISSPDLGVTTAKRWTSQVETAIRFLYPTFKRQPFAILLAWVLLGGLMITPFVALAEVSHDVQLFGLAALAAAVLWLDYSLVAVRTHPTSWIVTVLCLPFALVQELVLLLASMVVYEFGNVNWKGRNVCYPVIHPNQK